MEINQCDITMVIHYDITMGIPSNIITVTMGNDVASNIHCDVTMSNDVAMCTYYGITMHNDVDVNLFYYAFSAVYLIMILLWVVWNKIKNKFMFDQSGKHIHCFCVDLFLSSFGLLKYPYTNKTHVFSPNIHLFLL